MQLNNILTNAGFEEGSLAGLKWRSRVVIFNEALHESKEASKILKKQLDSTKL